MRKPTALKILTVIEPRRFRRDYCGKTLSKKKCFQDIQYVDTVQEALEVHRQRCKMNSGTVIEPLFWVCGITYLHLFRDIETIHTHVPKARILVFDEKPRQGCCFLADRLAIHGCCSCDDEPQEVARGLTEFAHNNLVVTTSVVPFLKSCPIRQSLVSHEKHRESELFMLDEREWSCFRHMTAGGNLESLVNLWGLQISTVRNYVSRMKEKIGAKETVDVFRIAQKWGFVE